MRRALAALALVGCSSSMPSSTGSPDAAMPCPPAAQSLTAALPIALAPDGAACAPSLSVQLQVMAGGVTADVNGEPCTVSSCGTGKFLVTCLGGASPIQWAWVTQPQDGQASEICQVNTTSQCGYATAACAFP